MNHNPTPTQDTTKTGMAGATFIKLLKTTVRWVFVMFFAVYGLAILAAGQLSYDIVYIFGSPRYSVEKLQQYSLVLGLFSISLAVLFSLSANYRNNLTMISAVLIPTIFIVVTFTRMGNYAKAYWTPKSENEIAGAAKIAKLTGSVYGDIRPEMAEMLRLNQVFIDHVRAKSEYVRDKIYSLPFKKRFKEGMADVQKEAEHFKKKQREAEQTR